MLTEGMPAPAVTLFDASGNAVSLQSFRGKPLVVFFYPKDNTPGCTAEACAFRDAYQDFVDAGATIIGVSSDDAESHEKFSAKYGLPFQLLSDPEGNARAAFDISKTLGILPGRATFVIDASGTIRYAFSSQFSPESHVTNALSALARA